jgi:hypothetical protein
MSCRFSFSFACCHFCVSCRFSFSLPISRQRATRRGAYSCTVEPSRRGSICSGPMRRAFSSSIPTVFSSSVHSAHWGLSLSAHLPSRHYSLPFWYFAVRDLLYIVLQLFACCSVSAPIFAGYQFMQLSIIYSALVKLDGDHRFFQSRGGCYGRLILWLVFILYR